MRSRTSRAAGRRAAVDGPPDDGPPDDGPPDDEPPDDEPPSETWTPLECGFNYASIEIDTAFVGAANVYVEINVFYENNRELDVERHSGSYQFAGDPVEVFVPFELSYVDPYCDVRDVRLNGLGLPPG